MIADALWNYWQDDDYALRHLPAHLLGSAQWDCLSDLLCNLAFLEAKAEKGMVFELAEDYKNALAAMPVDHPRRHVLALKEEAIRTDIHLLDRHPNRLFHCLWSRC